MIHCVSCSFFLPTFLKIIPSDELNLARSFQARLSVQSDSEVDVWILLTRHVVDSRKRNNEYISLDAEVEDEGSIPITGVTVSLRVRHSPGSVEVTRKLS